MRVALVNMPFASIGCASLQLGILKSVLVREGYEVDDFYLNLDFAKKMGARPYCRTVGVTDILLGDWFFSEVAFDLKSSESEKGYLDRHRDFLQKNYRDILGKDQVWDDWLLRVKKEMVPEWVERMLVETDWGQYDVVGFSCVFMQTVSSLALAKEIKKRWPHIKIVFGGSSVEEEMGKEITEQEPWIDCVVSGEGEAVILPLLSEWRQGRAHAKYVTPKQATDLQSLPIPDYDSYFRKVDKDPEYAFVEKEMGLTIPIICRLAQMAFIFNQSKNSFFSSLSLTIPFSFIRSNRFTFFGIASRFAV